MPDEVESAYRALVDARREFIAAKAETRVVVTKLKALRQRMRELKERRNDFGPAGGELGRLLAEMREEAAQIEANRSRTRERKRIQREAFVALKRQIRQIGDPVEQQQVASDLRDRIRREGATDGGERDRPSAAAERGRGFLERIDRSNVQPEYLETLIARIDELTGELVVPQGLARAAEPADGPEEIGDGNPDPPVVTPAADITAIRSRLLKERERVVRALGKDSR